MYGTTAGHVSGKFSLTPYNMMRMFCFIFNTDPHRLHVDSLNIAGTSTKFRFIRIRYGTTAGHVSGKFSLTLYKMMRMLCFIFNTDPPQTT